MHKIITRTALSLFGILAFAQATHNGINASYCEDLWIPGMTYSEEITNLCTPLWTVLTDQAKQELATLQDLRK